MLGQLTYNSGCWTGMLPAGPVVHRWSEAFMGEVRGLGSPSAGRRPRPTSLPEAQLHPSLTLSIMAKMRSTLFSGVFSSSGSSTVLPCREGQGQGWALGQNLPSRPGPVPDEDHPAFSLPMPGHLCHSILEHPSCPSPATAPALTCLPRWRCAE